MSADKMEWVEIIEPKTKEHMYANLTTGECVWDPPPGVQVKKTDNNQWWELFDQSTSRFYYYNATSQKTVWHRPRDCDIIPLAKLQTLKQNTEPVGSVNSCKNNSDRSLRCPANKSKMKETVSTQTQTPSTSRSAKLYKHPENPIFADTLQIGTGKANIQSKSTSNIQTSPISPSSSSRRHNLHQHSHLSNNRHLPMNSNSSSSNINNKLPNDQLSLPHLHSQRLSPQAPQSITPVRRQYNQSQDSGRSSDSSISHSRTSLESGGYRLVVDSPQFHHRASNHPVLSRSQQKQSSGREDFWESIETKDKNCTHESTLHSCQRSLPDFMGRQSCNITSFNTPLSKKKTLAQTTTETVKKDIKPNLEKKNNDLQQQVSQSYSLVSQQLKHKQEQQKFQQQQPKTIKQMSISRHCKRDDDSMHERFLLSQSLSEHIQQQIVNSSSTTDDSNASEESDSNSSNSCHPGEEIDDQTEALNVPDNNKKKHTHSNISPPPSPFYGNLLVDADHLLPLQHYILQQAKLSGCYKFGDPLVEEGDDSLDEDGERGAQFHERADHDSDDQFADDEAASNQGDSSSQEYLEDHYADLETYDTAALATYYNTTENLCRPQALSPPTLNIVSKSEISEKLTSSRIFGKNNGKISTPALRAGGGFSLSGLGSTFIDTTDYDEVGRRDDGVSGDIEKYAQDNLNLNCGRPKGLRLLFRKKCSIRDILSWSKDPIPQPMLVVVEGEKLLKREACNLFRLVQVYMGDRKANVGMTLDSVAMEIVNTIYSKPVLRDELYVQICRQTTENPRKESLRRGWELMAVCLAFVPPSAIFEPFLEGYMNRHRDPNFQFPEVAKWPIHVQVSHYATVACKRLQRIGAYGKRQSRKATIEDIDQARLQIFRASMFGATLSEVMAIQRERFPQRELPWIQTTLTRQVLIRGGTMTEGIFRVSADADEVNVLKARLDKFEDGATLAASQDAHAPASLLKLWVRELYEPLIPDLFYNECVDMRHDDHEASETNVAALVQRLPELNRRVLCHLIHFLQIFARSDVVARTKMDASNLAMVMAPNILRCTSQDPRIILENARKEMAFVRTMIETLETAWVENLH